MNDHWNNPPEDDLPPICCDDYMLCDDAGVMSCECCGAVIQPLPDIEPPDDPKELEGDYWHDELRDRKMEERQAKD